jgi:hypothetical protein
MATEAPVRLSTQRVQTLTARRERLEAVCKAALEQIANGETLTALSGSKGFTALEQLDRLSRVNNIIRRCKVGAALWTARGNRPFLTIDRLTEALNNAEWNVTQSSLRFNGGHPVFCSIRAAVEKASAGKAEADVEELLATIAGATQKRAQAIPSSAPHSLQGSPEVYIHQVGRVLRQVLWQLIEHLPPPMVAVHDRLEKGLARDEDPYKLLNAALEGLVRPGATA